MIREKRNNKDVPVPCESADARLANIQTTILIKALLDYSKQSHNTTDINLFTDRIVCANITDCSKTCTLQQVVFA
jgi:hypothetical protein